MKSKAIIAGGLASLVGVGLLFTYMKRFEEEASGGAPVRVLVAAQDIPLGSAVREEMLVIRDLPQSYVEDRHIPASEVQRILGVRVSSGVRANESLLWTDLATTSEQNRDLSSLVRSGMRAITIRADTTTSFGGLLRPGDRVDVLLTTEQVDSNEQVTLPLLQNLLVLASGRDTGGPQRYRPNASARASQVRQVTMSVTLEQANVLAYAQERGRITLTLRNPEDIRVVDGLAETTAADIIESSRRARVQRRRPARPEERSIERVQ